MTCVDGCVEAIGADSFHRQYRNIIPSDTVHAVRCPYQQSAATNRDNYQIWWTTILTQLFNQLVNYRLVAFPETNSGLTHSMIVNVIARHPMKDVAEFG